MRRFIYFLMILLVVFGTLSLFGCKPKEEVTEEETTEEGVTEETTEEEVTEGETTEGETTEGETTEETEPVTK